MRGELKVSSRAGPFQSMARLREYGREGAGVQDEGLGILQFTAMGVAGTCTSHIRGLLLSTQGQHSFTHPSQPTLVPAVLFWRQQSSQSPSPHR